MVINEARDEAAGLLDVERGAGANAVGFERLLPAVDFAVGLWIVRRSRGDLLYGFNALDRLQVHSCLEFGTVCSSFVFHVSG